MSAFIVDQDMIDLIISAGLEGAPGDRGLRVAHLGGVVEYSPDQDGGDHLTGILMRQNIASVNYRYDDGQTIDVRPFQWVRNIGGDSRAMIPWGHVLMALDCYEYQSCETPDWPTSPAAAACDAIRRKVCRRIASRDDAPWAWSREYCADRQTAHRATVTAMLSQTGVVD